MRRVGTALLIACASGWLHAGLKASTTCHAGLNASTTYHAGLTASNTYVVPTFRSARVWAQVPQPFPRPQTPAKPAPSTPEPSAPPPAQPAPAAQTVPTTDDAPTEAMLGFPIYPSAQFIASYDAGRGQRYYLFGSDLPFAALVKYYQTALRNRGTLVFDAPATHMFEIGRFREEAMAFPPGVTIKDYTWNGSAGYLNPKKDGKPERFASIIQIVPAPAGAPR